MNKAECTPDQKLLKVTTGMVVITGVIVSFVGLLIFREVSALGDRRVAAFADLKKEIVELREASESERANLQEWREQVNAKLERLSKEK